MREQQDRTATAETDTTVDAPTVPIVAAVVALFGGGRHHFHGGAKQKTVAQLKGESVGTRFRPEVAR